ncbi:MAG TPA: cellulase family glycosylhydrolase, partial [Bacillota bacterium]|nr:cellulase family glycosylhydrolase [Bacillota bacterium]
PNSVTFWRDVAKLYANHPAVLFDLYNEPRNVSWAVWRDGGEVTEKADNGDPLAYKTLGMQGLLNTVREAGAKNIVIVGGLDWGYDLSGVLKGFALQDKGGNGIMYGSHIYPWKGDWANKVGRIAEKYPVFVGEVGCEVDVHQENPYTWAPDMLGYIQQQKLHWTGWCFHPSASPRMLQDWNYTPTPYWGAFARAALAGAKFTPTRTR